MPLLNRWEVTKHGKVHWVADLQPALPYPDQLIQWFQQVLAAAETEEVLTVHKVAALDFDQQEDGPFSQFVVDHYQRTGRIEFDYYRREEDCRITGRVAYYDAATGAIVEEEVADLGAVWCACHPEECAVSWSRRYPWPPLYVFGQSLGTWAEDYFRRSVDFRGTVFQVVLPTDIWLPWVVGLVDETHAVDKVYDNRTLARRHTPRLNRFLTTAHAATAAIGGRWYLDREPDELRPSLAFMVHDTGIDLEATLPDGLTENDGTGISSYRKTELDGKAILAAVRQAKAHPDMPRTPVVVYRTPTPRLQQLLADQGILWHLRDESDSTT